jgi:hypothetical protein
MYPGSLHLPAEHNLYLHITMTTEELFTSYYNQNTWLGTESRSGLGSTIEQTATLRKQLPILFQEWGVDSILDLPCGDYNWMRYVDLSILYTGADIVRELVDSNQKYSDDKHCFLHLDLLTSCLPKVDLILCRDCLVHFSFADVKLAIANMVRSGSTYLLTTTFTNRTANAVIKIGEWTPRNLCTGPMHFPPPLAILNEGCTEYYPHFTDKSLGLWKLCDLT